MLIRILAAAALALVSSVQADPAFSDAHRSPGATSPGAQSEGEVRKVDKDQGKVTLRHGPLQNLDMPAMTMVFKVADPKVLDLLKDGDKVKFTAEKVNGVLTVTDMQPAR